MSGGASNIAINITANDRASSAIDRVNKQIASMRAPVDRTAKSIQKFSDVSGLGNLAKGMRSVGQESLQAFENITRMVGPLGAITSATSIAGMAALAVKWASLNSQLGFAAQRAGLTSAQLGALQGAAQLARASANSLTSGMTALNDNAFKAAIGHAPEVTAAFNFLGVAFMDANGHAKASTELLPILADKIAAIKDPALQAQLATTFFGGAAENLLPFLRLGAAGIDRLRQASERYNPITKDLTDAANRLREAQAELGLSATGLGNSILRDLEPTLTPLLHDFAEWIHDNPEIAKGIVKTASEITAFIAVLSALRFAWFLVGAARLAALGPVPLAIGAIGAAGALGAYGAYKSGEQIGDAASVGLRAASMDEFGNATSYINPTTGETVTIMELPAYIKSHQQATGGTAGPATMTASQNYSVEERALLDSIAGGEQSKAGYASQNPGSSAYGRYQFIDKTRLGLLARLGLPANTPLTPELQDKMALMLARDAGWHPGMSPGQSASILNGIWPSLPGGSQQNTSLDVWSQRLANATGIESMRDASPGIAAGTGASATGGADTHLTGGADIKITLNGFPQDTTHAADATGNMWNSAPRVEHAMPLSP